MGKIDLRKASGFGVTYNNEELEFTDLKCQTIAKVGLEILSSQFLNPEVNTPNNFYKKYIGIDHDDILKSKSLKWNIYVIESNLAGIEFTKTKANKVEAYPRILEVLSGNGTIILQKFNDEKSDDIIITKVRRQQKVIVPPGYAMSITNPKLTPLIVGEIHFIHSRIRRVLDDMRGMAYYIINKNSKQEIVRNPRYKTVDDFRKVDWDKIALEKQITLKTPLIKQVLRKYDKFDWLFEKDSLSI